IILFIYFYLETRQEKQYSAGDQDNEEHEVNLCVVQQSCDECCNIEDINIMCISCDIRQQVFKENRV
ncbi:hypothetical protein ACPXAU_24785, partial [Salmonella enterica]|uniref:hypothetical protein n=1 Tax=Salmonella enterica TaxID=28901 RepID=UPI003CFB3946